MSNNNEDFTPDDGDETPRTLLKKAAPKFLGGEDDKTKFLPPIMEPNQIKTEHLKKVYDAYMDLHSNIGVLNVKI